MFIYKSLLCGKIPPKKKKKKKPHSKPPSHFLSCTPPEGWSQNPRGARATLLESLLYAVKLIVVATRTLLLLTSIFLFPVKKEVYIICIR